MTLLRPDNADHSNESAPNSDPRLPDAETRLWRIHEAVLEEVKKMSEEEFAEVFGPQEETPEELRASFQRILKSAEEQAAQNRLRRKAP